jgi:KUP system potassium uptake protein
MDHSKLSTNKITAASLLVALGIIYGDIGTSPLYALRAVVGKREVSEMLVYGGVSCIFWTLVFQTSIKYIWLTLKADNQGEGGVFSLYALVRKYGRRLVIPTILGAATLLADGIITPPVSVASAVEGLKIVDGLEHMQTSTIVIIVIGILSLIFFFQRFGTETIGKVFGPVMSIWFLMLLVLGISQILHYPSVLKSLNPVYAYDFLTQKGGQGFWLLGAVFLCTTGAEALYSDLGHCGKKNIRITWAFVKVCLVANYMGQAAWIMHSGHDTMIGHNPFFEMMPSWFLLAGVIIATSAAIIASQALISGSFTLISEAMNLNFWPRVTVRQPTETKGQIYIPSVNTILWAGCVLIILYFQTSSRMEAAYGLAITLAMTMTTILLAYFVRYRLKWNPFFVAGMVITFAVIELSFFVANIIKFKDGGFITVIIAGLFFAVMYIIYFGRKVNNRFTKFVDLGKHTGRIIELSEDDEIPKFSTHLIYLTKANRREEIEEKIISSIFAKKPKRADVYWFVHINRTNQPYCLDYEVSELIDDKVIKVTVNIGFRIQPRTEFYFKKIVQDLVANKELNLHIRPDGSTKYNAEPDFRFVVIEKFLSVENEFALREGLLLNAYFFLKRLGQSDEKAFGLDKSDVAVEHIPLVYQPINTIQLTRRKQ